MKKYFLILILFPIVFIINSCDDSLNPNAPFRERYILNGIMQSDTTLQLITLSRSYQPDGTDPLTYKDDPAVTDAEVNVYYKNQLFIFRDTSITRTDESHYSTSLHYYYNNQLKPEPNEVIELNAILQNGLLLSSVVQVPNVTKDSFFDNTSDKIIPKIDDPTVKVSWKDLGANMFFPHIYIVYFIKGDSTAHNILLPLTFVEKNGSSVPIYISPSTNNAIKLDFPTIEKTLLSIPGTRADISILSINIDLVVYDDFVSKYYSSIKQGLDGFTIKLDSPDYTNIQGGFGIFGSIVKTTYQIRFRFDYLESLGFR